MATDQQLQAAEYLRSIAPYPPSPDLARLVADSRKVHDQIDAGLLRKVKNVGAYAAHIVSRLRDQRIDTDIELDVIKMLPSQLGWCATSKRALGAAWILREMPAVFVPEHISVTSHSVDRSNNEVVDPPHMDPAYGLALLSDATAVPYYREEDRGDVNDYGKPFVYRFDSFYLPSVNADSLNVPGPQEALAILSVCGVDDPQDRLDFVSPERAYASRAADSWANLFDRFVDRKGLQNANNAN